ncbi:unnamed protein product, partial [Didymodactylos carnosus]
SNHIRFRIQLNTSCTNGKIGIRELYIGDECKNACNGHGMCSNGSCRCESGWTNADCSLSLAGFPNELDILNTEYYTTTGALKGNKCNVSHSFIFIELRVTQDPIPGSLLSTPWSIEEFNVFHIHKELRWSSQMNDNWNTTFLDGIHIERGTFCHIPYVFLINCNHSMLITKDVYYSRDYILQLEIANGCGNQTNDIYIDYSIDLGESWSNLASYELSLTTIFIPPTNDYVRVTVPFKVLTVVENR